ncbi:prevent-host-death family protein [Micrococcales bacterium KH10]|nr:prevent-host-death family protein [Micrococcales bacterium KH10]
MSGLIGKEPSGSGKSVVFNLYKSYNDFMTSVTLSQFRNQQSDYIAAAQREPVEITSRGAGRRAVLVSPEFFDRAVEALEDQLDIRAAAAARADSERIPFDELMEELGL